MLILLLLVINISCSLFSAQESIPFTNPFRSFARDYEFLNKKIYDGFCAGTLVKTPSGYIPIEALYIGDYVLDSCNQPKKIEGITFRWVPNYLSMQLNDGHFGVGIHQLFYYQSDWAAITEIDRVFTAGGSNVSFDVERVEDSTWLHVLTVEDHTFCITTHDLIVHNAEAFIIGALGIALENFSISPAAISAVQATLSLSFISYRALQDYCVQQDTHNRDFNEVELCQKTRRAEREYFGNRKRELENLRDEFLAIKNGLLSYKSGTSFTSLFFRQQTFLQPISSVDLVPVNEMQLSEFQYATLRTAREMHLSMLEQEIDNLQLVIALHFNAIIENVRWAEEYHWQVAIITSETINAWNFWRLKTIPIDIVYQHYEHCLYDYYSLQKARQCLEELKAMLNFYRNQLSRPYFIKTIPIQELLEKMPSFVKNHEKWIGEENARITRNIKITEEHCEYHNIYCVQILPQIKAAFEKHWEEQRKNQCFAFQKQQEALKQKYDEAKRSSRNNNEAPNNPRNNDKYENMYEVFARAPIGKKLKEVVKDAARRYKDSKMYRVMKDVEEFGIKKDDWLYLDKMHKDHIEVFAKNGEDLRTILNMDGTQNLKKVAQAGIRNILQWIR